MKEMKHMAKTKEILRNIAGTVFRTDPIFHQPPLKRNKSGTENERIEERLKAIRALWTIVGDLNLLDEFELSSAICAVLETWEEGQ